MAGGGNLMKRFIWTPEKISVLTENFPHKKSADVAALIPAPLVSVRHKASELGLKKSEAFKNSPDSGRLMKGDERGAKTRYPKGNIPWTKGMKGLKIPGSEKGHFKKGHLPHNTKNDHDISVRNDAATGRPYQWIRVALGKWVHLHVHVWHNAHGDVPEGYVISFKDGDTMNATPENLQLITMAENMARNTIHRYPEDIKSAMRLLGRLKKKLNEKQD
jgi:hypothetical protein